MANSSSLDVVTITGIQELEQQLRVINSPALRRRIINKIATRVVTKSKRRIRDEIDLQGRPWPPRSAKAPKSLKKKKMMRGLYKALKVQSKSNVSVTIGFAGFGKNVAVRQQQGFTRQFSRAQLQPDKISPATLAQAQRLLQLGYKKPDGKKPSLAWIKQNLTAASAGKIIIEMRGYPAKDTWTAVIPARSFLGITLQDKQDINQMIINEINFALSQGQS